MPSRAALALTIVRVAAAAMMVIHGAARASLGIVDDFGVVLETWGLPTGFLLAWTITAVEIAGGASLAAGLFVRPIAAWFVLQLVAGIVLIHGRAGWFVVGAGRNGMEYSVLLIVCLAVVLLADGGALGAGRGRGGDAQPLGRACSR